MRAGLNALHLVPGETGGAELYARRLVPALLERRPELQLVVWCAGEAAPALALEPWAASVRIVRLPVRARSRPLRVAAEQLLLPLAARRAGVELIHNLFTTAPAIPGLPQVTTILDVIYKRHPETHTRLFSRGMALLVPLAVRRSTRLIAISEATRRDLVELLGVAPERIDVTPLALGVTGTAEPLPAAELRRRLELGDRRLVLSVSAKRPHKNLPRLVDALADVDDAVLVLPGYPTPHEQELRRRARELGVADRVRFTGWVDESLLEGLYAAADCFVFPSLAEGFGLPVLEALARGLPVACSNATSLPEVAGDAALYFDPLDASAIAAAINRLLNDRELASRLRARGPERAGRFSWQRTAELTLASYEHALEAR